MDKHFIAGAALTAALEAAGHWFPWPSKLHRVGAYTYGVSAILVGLAVATERHHWLRTAGICAAGGLATIAAYAVDRLLVARQKWRVYVRNP